MTNDEVRMTNRNMPLQSFFMLLPFVVSVVVQIPLSYFLDVYAVLGGSMIELAEALGDALDGGASAPLRVAAYG